MTIEDNIQSYISSLSEPKRSEMGELHRLILGISPKSRLWYEDGKNSEGKVISNPNIGYGLYTIQYANGTTRDFFRIGISANKTGISVYILGITDKEYLSKTYGTILGKASITGYCIKFKSLKDIHIDVLKSAIQYGLEYSHRP